MEEIKRLRNREGYLKERNEGNEERRKGKSVDGRDI
jgi:hypothetical protein